LPDKKQWSSRKLKFLLKRQNEFSAEDFVSTPLHLNQGEPASVTRLDGPFCLTAWIPFISDYEAEYQNSAFPLYPDYLRQVGESRRPRSWYRAGIKYLFWTGNATGGILNDPNPEMMDEEALLDLANSVNFRAVLGVKNVKLYRDASGLPLYATIEHFAASGYTLFRSTLESSPDHYLMASVGQGSKVEPKIEVLKENPLAALIRVHYGFVLGKFALRCGRVLFRQGAPYARIEMRLYIIDESTRQVGITSAGSTIPSQACYEGEELLHHNIFSSTLPEIHGFMTAGNYQLSPFHLWSTDIKKVAFSVEQFQT
jgi:hypothetical protein